MIRLGLTGSIAMGKSTTAKLFAQEGVPVIDADAIVHQLYQGAAVAPVGQAFPEAIRDGMVDRPALAARIAADPAALRTLESIVHPLVQAEQIRQIRAARAAGADIVVLDIPLLFETGAQGRVDRIAVVTAPAEIQRARALARPAMSVEKFETLLARQMPDAEKRARADFLIDTSGGIEAARAQVRAVIAALRKPATAAP